MTAILDLRYNLGQTLINKHQTKIINRAFTCEKNTKKEVEFTFLIAILFFTHLRVNRECRGHNGFFFKMYLSVMFIPGPLS